MEEKDKKKKRAGDGNPREEQLGDHAIAAAIIDERTHGCDVGWGERERERERERFKEERRQ